MDLERYHGISIHNVHLAFGLSLFRFRQACDHYIMERSTHDRPLRDSRLPSPI